MSLFKLKDLWSTQCGKDETFESNGLVIADFFGFGVDCIIVGSQNGLLRIFNPQPDLGNSEQSGFKPTDLLIETQLPHPILQVSVGKLVS